MPGPTVTFGFILATIFGALFHIVVGGDARRLALFLLSGWIGFSLGHVLGETLEIDIAPIGSLNIVPAALGALVALVVARFLTKSRGAGRASR